MIEECHHEIDKYVVEKRREQKEREINNWKPIKERKGTYD